MQGLCRVRRGEAALGICCHQVVDGVVAWPEHLGPWSQGSPSQARHLEDTPPPRPPRAPYPGPGRPALAGHLDFVAPLLFFLTRKTKFLPLVGKHHVPKKDRRNPPSTELETEAGSCLVVWEVVEPKQTRLWGRWALTARAAGADAEGIPWPDSAPSSSPRAPADPKPPDDSRRWVPLTSLRQPEISSLGARGLPHLSPTSGAGRNRGLRHPRCGGQDTFLPASVTKGRRPRAQEQLWGGGPGAGPSAHMEGAGALGWRSTSTGPSDTRLARGSRVPGPGEGRGLCRGRGPRRPLTSAGRAPGGWMEAARRPRPGLRRRRPSSGGG